MKVSALVDRYLVEVPRACGMSVSSIRCALAVSQIGTETAFLKQIPYIETLWTPTAMAHTAYLKK